MLEINELKSDDSRLFNYTQTLIEKTFPSNEYRPFEELKSLMRNDDRFSVNTILDDTKPIGVISIWDFGSFNFVELFAMDEAVRNKGYGSKVLQQICQRLIHPIVLEIEQPDTDIAIRRKGFYERNQFVTWSAPYFQPPFRKGDSIIPLNLCCYGPLNSKHDFERIKQTIHREVYNYHQE